MTQHSTFRVLSALVAAIAFALLPSLHLAWHAGSEGPAYHHSGSGHSHGHSHHGGCGSSHSHPLPSSEGSAPDGSDSHCPFCDDATILCVALTPPPTDDATTLRLTFELPQAVVALLSRLASGLHSRDPPALSNPFVST